MDGARRRLVVAAACALVFAVLALAYPSAAGLDRAVQAFAVAHRSPWLNTVMETLTRLGSSLVLVPVLVIASVYAWWRGRDLRAVAGLWAAFGGAMLLFHVLKALFGRARPPVEQMVVHTGGYAFPSGHSTQAMAVWGLLAAVAVAAHPTRRAWIVVPAAVIILLVGASRIYLGVHWLTDVLAGFAVGAAWFTLLLAAGGRRAARARAPETSPYAGREE